MKIEWSPKARLDYIQNITYLAEKWSQKEIIVFNESIGYNLKLLESGILSFTKTNHKDVFKVVLIKQITLYYSINNDTVRILRFWNNYQRPEKFTLY
jgi:plasmid stabilization system protein ParE